MTTSPKKKVFLFIFCLASITQGMYSTYFVSILTTIESIYQIQSKTAGALLSATEIGQILGSLFIAYYGGRGNKPKWIAACMTFSALAALISIAPHLFLTTLNATNRNDNQQKMTTSSTTNDGPIVNASLSTIAGPSAYQAKDLARLEDTSPTKQKLNNVEPLTTTMAPILTLPSKDDLCRWDNPSINASNLTKQDNSASPSPDPDARSHINKQRDNSIPAGIVIVIFFICLLAIGFGSTAITTLGIPFIDDIISKEESPLYLGLTIGLKIFGPALGFLLGSFCIRLDVSKTVLADVFITNEFATDIITHTTSAYGAWWLGLIIISIPLVILAIPMYYLSGSISGDKSERDDFDDITYQAAEDHDIGGSHDFPPHMLALAPDLDVTSNRTCFSSEIDSSSREVLQSFNQSAPSNQHLYSNYVRNLTLEQPVIYDGGLVSREKIPKLTLPAVCTNTGENRIDDSKQTNSGWDANVCVVVNHFGGLESTSFTNSVANQSSPLDQNDQVSPCITYHPQRPPPPSSSRSSLASSLSSSSSSTEVGANEVNDKNDSKKKRKRKNMVAFAGLLSSLSRLLNSRLLTLRMLSGILHILPIAGFYTFLPKYLIEQFRVTQSSASAISGLAGILFVGLGAFLGGTIVRLFNINSRLMTRWIALSALLYAIGMIVLMNLGCNNNHIVYHKSNEFTLTDCSTSCKCSNAIYSPVCANGTTYISPCLAGCKSHSISEGKIIYDECGCIANPLQTTITSNVTAMPLPHEHVNLNVATQGHCQVECDNLIWYIIVFSAFTLMHASCEVGSMMFNLRCVKSSDRTLALGLIAFASSLLGKW